MTADAWVTVAVLVVVVVVLVRDVVPPAVTVLGGVVLLTLSGVLEPEQAFAGFAAPATATIAALFIVARAVRETGLLDVGVSRLLGPATTERRILARLVGPVAVASSVIANTPIVATLASPVRSWAERHGHPPSRYLMPLSFAAILGGTITAIGTSTTLLVSGLLGQAGEEEFAVFELTPVGAPVAVTGAVALVLLAPRLLPDRRDPVAQISSDERQYTFQMRVIPDGALDGASVRDADLRDLGEVFLARVDRGPREFVPVAPDEHLEGGDILTFVGRVDHVRDISERKGLRHAAGQHVDLLEGDRHGFYEAIIGPGSSLVGTTPKAVAFRGRYGAAILAVHRAGERVEGQLGEVQLQSGDALILMSDPDFTRRWEDSSDFLVVVPLDAPEAKVDRHAAIALGVLVAMVAVAAAGLVPILHAALGAVLVLGLTGAVTVPQARDALDLDVLFLVAGSFGLGAAVESSGLAGLAADGIAAAARSSGGVLALALVLLSTALLTELVSNAASAGLMLPIALQVAERTGSDPRGFAVAVALAASASFLTPIGYQTNTIVYGLGGYRYGDYWRLGAPLNLVAFLVSVAVIPLVWQV